MSAGNHAQGVSLSCEQLHIKHTIFVPETTPFQKISKIKHIQECNIGHFIIAESVFISLSNSIKKFKKIINN